MARRALVGGACFVWAFGSMRGRGKEEAMVMKRSGGVTAVMVTAVTAVMDSSDSSDGDSSDGQQWQQ